MISADREAFRKRMQEYKSSGLKYWDWKANSYATGTNDVEPGEDGSDSVGYAGIPASTSVDGRTKYMYVEKDPTREADYITQLPEVTIKPNGENYYHEAGRKAAPYLAAGIFGPMALMGGIEIAPQFLNVADKFAGNVYNFLANNVYGNGIVKAANATSFIDGASNLLNNAKNNKLNMSSQNLADLAKVGIPLAMEFGSNKFKFLNHLTKGLTSIYNPSTYTNAIAKSFNAGSSVGKILNSTNKLVAAGYGGHKFYENADNIKNDLNTIFNPQTTAYNKLGALVDAGFNVQNGFYNSKNLINGINDINTISPKFNNLYNDLSSVTKFIRRADKFKKINNSFNKINNGVKSINSMNTSINNFDQLKLNFLQRDNQPSYEHIEDYYSKENQPQFIQGN